MNRHNVLLGHVWGIPIRLDFSWFLIFILLTWTLAVGYFPQQFPGWSPPQYWAAGALTTILQFGSVLLHELGHSAVALSYGIPVRGITLFIFGGIAVISQGPKTPASQFWISIAGPGVSFALGGAFLLLGFIFDGNTPLAAVVLYLAYINIALAVFNLVPGFPLDGGGVLRALLWGITKDVHRATLIAATTGRVIACGFILLGVWVMLEGALFSGLWLAFIGWFLETAARSQVHQERLQHLLAGHKVSEAMDHDYDAVDAAATLQQTVDEHIIARGCRSLVVRQGEDLTGLVTLHRIKTVPRDKWAATPVSAIMIPAAEVKVTRPGAELWTALEQMDRSGVNQLPVMDDCRVVGMLSRDDIISHLQLRRELGV
jgi:Zn-dependent protease/CBS domain-containing protein